MSASEYLRCAPKYTISRLNNQNFSGEGAVAPYPLGTFGASLLAPSALVPPLKNPGYAPGDGDGVAAPSQEPHPTLGLRPFGLRPVKNPGHALELITGIFFDDND